MRECRSRLELPIRVRRISTDVCQTKREAFTRMGRVVMRENVKPNESQRRFPRLHDDNGPREGQSSRDCEVEE